MSGLSHFLRAKMLDHALGTASFTPAASLEVRLYTSAPNDSGGGTEVTGGSYAPVTLTNNSTNFPLCPGGVVQKTNGTAITFPAASAAWGNITHWAIYGGSDMYAWGPLASSNYVDTGFVAEFDIGELRITLLESTYNGFMADIQKKLLDRAFGSAAYTFPSAPYLLIGDDPWNDGSCVNGDTGFVPRQQITFPACVVGETSVANPSTVTAASSPVSTINIERFFLMDAITGGNPIAFGRTSKEVRAVIGTPFTYAAGDIAVTLD